MIIKPLNWKINYVINIWREKRVINFQGYTRWRERRKGKKGRERKTMEAERKIPGTPSSTVVDNRSIRTASRISRGIFEISTPRRTVWATRGAS